jgi:hypothetical protein
MALMIPLSFLPADDLLRFNGVTWWGGSFNKLLKKPELSTLLGSGTFYTVL